jgi:transposase
VAERRTAWRVKQLGLNPPHLVFIDETAVKTNFTRLRGRAPRGQRLVEKVPYGHWKTTTLIAALDMRGMRCALTVDGAVNGEVFRTFIRQVLAPTLHPGDLVVLDNLAAHKVAGVREAITAAKAEVVYLPPYSPDLNPIENAFSKLKQGLRSAQHRTQETLWNNTQQVLETITPSDADGYFRHCGYTLQVK